MPMLGGSVDRMRMLAVFIVGLSCAAAHAARPADLVKAELLADVDAVKVGEPFALGVRLKVKPAWHVYWKYPGDSGSATKVELKLPDGWQASPPQFPIPKRFNQPGDIIGYGYEDEVMLIATVTPPAELKSGAAGEIVANVKWLSCADVCIPGKAELKLSLPAGEESKPANAELFKTWMERLPAKGSPALGTTSLSRGTTPRYFALAKFDAPYQNIEWFPLPPDKIGVDDGQTKTQGNESSFSFGLLPQPKSSDQMSFLVAFTAADGQRRGVEFTLNLPPASQSPGGS